jgi:hypothetical protein
MPDPKRSQPPKLLQEIRTVLRLHHYSIHTERAYVEWVVRFIRFHRMRSRPDLFPALQQGSHGVPSPLNDLGV